MSKCCIAKPYTALRDLLRRVTRLEVAGSPVSDAENLGGMPPHYYKSVGDVVTFEEIAASDDLSGKIPAASAIAELAGMHDFIYLGSSEQDNVFRFNFSELDVEDGVYIFVSKMQLALLNRSYGAWTICGTINNGSASSINSNEAVIYCGSWYSSCYIKQINVEV